MFPPFRMNGMYIVGVVSIIICCLLALIGLLFVIGYAIEEDLGEGIAFGVMGFLVFAVIITSLVGVNWPLFDTSYHRNELRTFVVQDVDVRMVDQTQQYALTNLSGQVYKCVDTRCATVHKGDTITLSCLKQWQRYGTPGYDCDFVELKRQG